MKRVDLARAIAGHLDDDAVVVCGLGSTRRAWASIEDPRLVYYASDPMGLAPSIALGFALAAPGLEVCLLQGDGDLLMTMESLATIAAAAPANLRAVVFHNRIYETGGRRALAISPELDLAGVARAAGFAFAERADSDGDVDSMLGRLMAASGPGLVVVSVDEEVSPYGDPPRWTQVEMKAFFLAALEGP